MADAKKTPARGKTTTASPKKTARKAPAKPKTAAKKTAPKKTRAKKAPAKKTTTAQQDQVVQPDESRPQRYCARNRTGYEYGLRLDRQDKGKKRFDLKPRGQRGDFAPLQDGDLEDPTLMEAVYNGTIEIITATEAAKIAQKQTTNQQRVHPALALLRNELGEEYEEGAVTMAESFEDQGVVVAELHDGQIAVDRTGIVRPGNDPIPERPGRAGQRLRRPGEGPRSSPLVSQSQLRVRPSDQTSAATDAKARRKGLGGPKAGVPDGVQVTVAPTQHT